MELRNGSIVRIAKNCRMTKNGWGYNTGMKRMEGTIHTIKSITDYADGVKLRGYSHTWHKEDLEPVTTPEDLTIPIPKDQQSTFTFDPKEI